MIENFIRRVHVPWVKVSDCCLLNLFRGEKIVFHHRKNRGQLAHVSSQSSEADFARSHGGALRRVNSRRKSIDRRESEEPVRASQIAVRQATPDRGRRAPSPRPPIVPCADGIDRLNRPTARSSFSRLD